MNFSGNVLSISFEYEILFKMSLIGNSFIRKKRNCKILCDLISSQIKLRKILEALEVRNTFLYQLNKGYLFPKALGFGGILI